MSDRATTVDENMAAACQSCGWTDDAPGALGRAARHHDATGHEVTTTVTRVIRYGDRDSALAAQGQEAMEV